MSVCLKQQKKKKIKKQTESFHSRKHVVLRLVKVKLKTDIEIAQWSDTYVATVFT